MRERGMVEPIFSRQGVEKMKPYINKTVDNLLSDMIKAGCKQPVDLVEKFSLPVPSYVGPSHNQHWVAEG